MESLRKQATKLRETERVVKQQQAVLSQLGSLSNEAGKVDEAEILYRQQLHDLYTFTRAGEAQQQQMTFQKLLTMIVVELSYRNYCKLQICKRDKAVWTDKVLQIEKETKESLEHIRRNIVEIKIFSPESRKIC